MQTKSSARPCQISAYPYSNSQPSLVPLAQSNVNWHCSPMPKASGSCTDHFATWRHDLSRSWFIPQPLALHSQNLGHIPSMSLPKLEYPASPSQSSCSPASMRTDSASHPSQYIHVVCDVPLVVPKPRPYRILTPIDFDLPSEDQDLSHPPYTTRSSSKRKHTNSDETSAERAKRRFFSESSVTAILASCPSKVSQSRIRNTSSRPR